MRATICVQKPLISTHTLTWSVTRYNVCEMRCMGNFNSHAHVERDVKADICSTFFIYFNSHAHVERDHSPVLIVAERLLFQLTRSRGA